MAFDGILISKLIKEIQSDINGCKIEKIYQNGEFEITLTFRNGKKLLISANPSMPYFCLLENKLDAPAMPPSFCMQLRKYILNGRLTDIVQYGLDRIVCFSFEASDEMGDKRVVKLICEFMGRHSNIILVDEAENILGAVKYVNSRMSSFRQILPGLKYRRPPEQNKANPFLANGDELQDIINSGNSAKAFLEAFSGFSKQLSEEALVRCNKEGNAVESFKSLISEDVPVIVRKEKKEYADIVFYRPTNADYIVKNSYSQAVYEFYRVKTKQSIAKQKAGDLFKLLNNHIERINSKLNKQQDELDEVRSFEESKRKGDILSANAYRIKKGMELVCLEDFYNGGNIEIKLEPELEVSENISLYYKSFKKKKRTFESLTELIDTAKKELDYLKSVMYFLSSNNDEADIKDIKEELAADGYIKKKPDGKLNQKLKPSKPFSFRSSNGTEILVGRNNLQNEALTFKTAFKNYIWLHVKNYPGSHVVIMKPSGEVDDITIKEAALLAARHSKAAAAGKATVDYTEIKNVRKQPGGKPGMVYYVNYKSVEVAV